MESGFTWEYSTLINELTQGLEKAKQLRFHLYSSEAPDLLLQKVLASYEKALFILQRATSAGPPKPAVLLPRDPDSLVSVDGGTKNQEAKKNSRDHQENINTRKKRKLQHTWSEEVRISSENRLEGPPDDGYSWRKYGQKDILAAKYPRSYYRCTYRLLQSCRAIKQVQRSDEDPTTFVITYKGPHTCKHSSPAKQEPEHKLDIHQPQEQNRTPLNLKSNLRVNTEDLDNKDTPVHFLFPSTFACHDTDNNYCYPTYGLVDDSNQGEFSSLFYYPDTSETNYLAEETYRMMYEEAPNVQQSGSDISEIISAHASTTNSPIGSMEFPFDHADLDPTFPFNTLGFYA